MSNHSSHLIIKIIVPIFLFFTTCKEPDNLGLNLRSDRNNGVIYFTDTLTLDSYTVLNDSINSTNLDHIVAGSYKDPVLGNVNAKCFTQVLLSKNNIQFPSETILDSVVLKLEYYAFYGDTNVKQTINVYELKQELVSGTNYYIFSDMNTANLLGTKLIRASFDSISVGGAFQKSHLRIPLDTNFFRQKIIDKSKSGDSILFDNSRFTKYFNGICVAPQDFGQGAVITFKIRSSFSAITFYYRADTSYYALDFPINDNAIRFSNIYLDKNNGKLNNLAKNDTGINENSTENLVYLQSGTGLRTRFTIPNLINMKLFNTRTRNISINKADLIINVKDYSGLKPPNYLLIYPVADSSGKMATNPLQHENYSTGSTNYPLIMNYDTTSKSYSNGSIPKYIQEILIGTRKNYGFVISPGNLGSSINRAVIYGNKYSDKTKSLKLKLYYTFVE